MKTTITGRNDRESAVTHILHEGETWERFGMDQPNPVFSHDEGWMRNCPVCARPLRVKPRGERAT